MKPTGDASSSWLFYSAINILGNTLLLIFLGLGAKRVNIPYQNIMFSMGVGFIMLAIATNMVTRTPISHLVNWSPQFWQGVAGAIFFGVCIIYTLLASSKLAPNPMYPVLMSHVATPLALIGLAFITCYFPQIVSEMVAIKPQLIIGGTVIAIGVIICKVTTEDLKTAYGFGHKMAAYFYALLF